MGAGIQSLGLSSSSSQVHLQEAGLKAKQLGLEPTLLIRDAGFPSRSLICCATMPATYETFKRNAALDGQGMLLVLHFCSLGLSCVSLCRALGFLLYLAPSARDWVPTDTLHNFGPISCIFVLSRRLWAGFPRRSQGNLWALHPFCVHLSNKKGLWCLERLCFCSEHPLHGQS